MSDGQQLAENTVEYVKVLSYMERIVADLEKRMDTLHEEHRYQQGVADRTRSESAEALAANLRQTIQEGDANLARHIQEQVESVRAALQAQEKLSDEKDRRMQQMSEAQQRAVDKAESSAAMRVEKLSESVKERLDQGNHVRSQLQDQAATFATRDLVHEQFSSAQRDRENLRLQLQKLEAMVSDNFLRIDVWNSTVAEWTIWRNVTNDRLHDLVGRKEYDKAEEEWGEWRQTVEARLNLQRGSETGLERRREAVQPWMLVGATVVVSLVIALANVLTTL